MVKEKIRYLHEYEFTYIDSPKREDRVANRRWKRRTEKLELKKQTEQSEIWGDSLSEE